MEGRRLNASRLRSAGYDAPTRTLEIEFTSGSIVRYESMPQDAYRRFVASPSPGSFFEDYIDDVYAARRLR